MHTASADRYSPSTMPPLVTNGVIGLRVPRLAVLGGTCTVNGYVERPHPRQAQGWAAGPYPLRCDLQVDTAWLSSAPEAASLREQAYDLASGLLTTRFYVTLAEARLEAEVQTFASRTWPHAVLQRVTVASDRETELSFVSGIDSPVSGRELYFEADLFPDKQLADQAYLFESAGELSTLGVAQSSLIEGDESHKQPGRQTRHRVRVRPGRPVSLIQFAALVPSLCHSEPDRQAIRLCHEALRRGWRALLDEHRAAWAELWRGRVVIDGPESAQRTADACFFHLHASMHPSMPANSGLLGLGMWPTYHMFRGHAFWDIETFAVPTLALTDPPSAMRILEQRRDLLPAARSNARMNGRRGAQFPWEAGTTGEEVTGIDWPAVFVEHHITPDVALAAARVAHVTGDDLFRREVAWPILRDVAEWVVSRVARTARGLEILDVCGIDEGRPHVDNNAWTNAGAIEVLREAAALAEALGGAPPARWVHTAASIFMPIRDGVLLKYDDAPDEQGLCPDASAAFFPMGWRPSDPDLEARTLRYYLDRRHGYIGYPMLSSQMYVWAARLGDRRLSAELWREGAEEFLFGPFDQLDEFGREMTEGIKAQVGPYLAHAGGILTGLLYGLPRLRPNGGEGGWCEGSVTLPAGWEAVRTERLHVRGRPVRLTAQHGEVTDLAEM